MPGEQDGPPPAKKLRPSFSENIVVLVGKEKKSFVVHKDIICRRSPFFEAACSKRWTRSAEKPIELPDESEQTFDIYCNIVYNNTVDVSNSKGVQVKEEAPDERFTIESRLTATYILADKLGDIAAANMIIDEIIREKDELRMGPYESNISEAMKALAIDSPLCRLFIDYYVYRTSSASISASLKDDFLPKAFFYKVLEEKARLIDENIDKKAFKIFRRDFVNRNRCHYHQHSEEHPTCADTQAEDDTAKRAV